MTSGAAYNEEQDSGCMSSDELHPATMTTTMSGTAGADPTAASGVDTSSASQAAEERNDAETAATTRRLGRELWLHMLSCRCRPIALCPDARCRAAKRLLHHRVTCQVARVASFQIPPSPSSDLTQICTQPSARTPLITLPPTSSPLLLYRAAVRSALRSAPSPRPRWRLRQTLARSLDRAGSWIAPMSMR